MVPKALLCYDLPRASFVDSRAFYEVHFVRCSVNIGMLGGMIGFDHADGLNGQDKGKWEAIRYAR